MISRTATNHHLLSIKTSSIHGTGVFAAADIPPDMRIIEYVGEIIDKSESQARCEQNNEFIFCLDEARDIDGNVEWNLARFINHSCAPNCAAELIDGHIWVISNRRILTGEELSFNYGYDLEDYLDHPCRCGARNCIGYIVSEEFFGTVRRKLAWMNMDNPSPAMKLDSRSVPE